MDVIQPSAQHLHGLRTQMQGLRRVLYITLATLNSCRRNMMRTIEKLDSDSGSRQGALHEVTAHGHGVQVSHQLRVEGDEVRLRLRTHGCVRLACRR